MASRKNQPSEHSLVKVLFKLDPDSWHASFTETLWAEPVGSSEYQLENVPFYAFGVSLGDAVRAIEGDGVHVFTEVSRRGGHSTYRLLINESRRDDLEKFWEPLQALGCTYEEGPKPLLAVDVPPEANIFDVYDRLEQGERAEVWSFEEGHCGHLPSSRRRKPKPFETKEIFDGGRLEK